MGARPRPMSFVSGKLHKSYLNKIEIVEDTGRIPATIESDNSPGSRDLQRL